MTRKEAVKFFLLGMIAAALIVNALRPATSGQAVAAGGASSAASGGGLMAVTGPRDATLFLIDPTNKFMTVYSSSSGNFLMRAARHFPHDLSIYDFKGHLTVDEAKKKANRDKKKLLKDWDD